MSLTAAAPLLAGRLSRQAVAVGAQAAGEEDSVRRIVMFSSGIGSWAAAKRVVERYGTWGLTLLFTDTLMEDADNYRFLEEAARRLGADLVRLVEGRNPWQVFFDERFIGNSRADPCSRILKREMAAHWLAQHCDPADTIVYTGIDWTEEHRHKRLSERRLPWRYEAPMCESPYLTKTAMLDLARAEGLEPPRLYRMAFSHSNCSAFCIKAGIGHYVNLLDQMPKRYAYHEAMEQMLRAHIGADVAILRDRRKGHEGPLTLRDLRLRLQDGEQFDLFDIGGCGCFVDAPS